MDFHQIDKDLKSFPTELFQKDNYEYHSVNLSKNHLQNIPPLISSLRNLTYLDLSFNKLKELPTEIVYLSKLKFMNMSNNQITLLPSELSQIDNLEVINFSNNLLKYLPNTYFPSLKEIDISLNQITRVCPQICQSPKLEIINIKGNPIKDLPHEIKDMKSLKSESIEHIYEVYEVLKKKISDKIVNTTDLIMKEESLEVIPTCIDLFQLKMVDLSLNSIKTLNFHLFKLKNLEHLSLRGNLITSLPEQIGDLSNLIFLDISYNKLTDLPESFASLSRLKTLKLLNNPFKKIDIPKFENIDKDSLNELELLEKIFQRMDFYESLYNEEQDYVQKLSILQSSFINGLKQNSILSDEKQKILFSEIVFIADLHKEFLLELEKVIKNSNGKDVNFLPLIGKYLDPFKLYSRYIVDLEKNILILREELYANSKFKQFVDLIVSTYNISHKDSTIDFIELYKLPSHKMENMAKSFKTLQSLTPYEHELYEPIKKSKETFEEIVDYFEVKKVESVNMKRLNEIVKEIHDNSIISPTRSLIDEYPSVIFSDTEDFKKTTNSKLFFFNDMILINESKIIKIPLRCVFLDRIDVDRVRLETGGYNKFLRFHSELEREQFYTSWYIYLEKFWVKFFKENEPNYFIQQALLVPRGSRGSIGLKAMTITTPPQKTETEKKGLRKSFSWNSFTSKKSSPEHSDVDNNIISPLSSPRINLIPTNVNNGSFSGKSLQKINSVLTMRRSSSGSESSIKEMTIILRNRINDSLDKNEHDKVGHWVELLKKLKNVKVEETENLIQEIRKELV